MFNTSSAAAATSISPVTILALFVPAGRGRTLLALAVALPCAIVLAYSIFSDARHSQLQVEATALALAQLVASHTQQFVTDSENVLTRLSTRPLVRSLDPARRPGNFDTFLDLH